MTINAGAFPIHADAGDHLWATEAEKREQWLVQTEPVEMFDDHWKEALGFALAGALLFSWQVSALADRMSRSFMRRA